MRVLSLFDGMACGMLAMQKAGVPIERYVAYEYDEETANAQKGRPFGFAAFTSAHNFPMIEHKGDVFQADFTEFSGFDFLVGGSPCTYWSIAQKNNRETEASGLGWELFSQYVRALKEAKPKFFIYENNKSMAKAIRESITETFGFEPICINSALVSAQNRQRLYWVGKRNEDGSYSKVAVEQPEDRGILLKDVLDGVAWLDKSYTIDSNYHKTLGQQGFERQSGRRKMVAERVAQPFGETNGKAFALTASYWKGQPVNKVLEKSQRTHVSVPIRIGTWPNTAKNQAHDSQQYRIYSTEGKSVNLCGNGGGMGAKTGLYAVPVNDTAEGKAQCLRATCYKDGIRNMVGNDIDRKTCVGERVPGYGYANKGRPLSASYARKGDGEGSLASDAFPENPNKQVFDFCAEEVQRCAVAIEWDEDGRPIKAVSGADGKEHPVYEVRDGFITIKGKKHAIKLADGYYIIRKLTVSECKRLQTVPEWFEFPVSDTQAYKMLGNGWTVDVIAHLIRAAQWGGNANGE